LGGDLVKRNVTGPKNPDAVGRLIAALRVYSGQRKPRNKAERSINDTLKAQRVSPAVAKRMVANLDKVPQNTRDRLLGKIAAPSFVPPAKAASPPTTASTVTIPFSAFQILVHPGPAEPDPEPVVPVYKIRYRGLYCQEETSWDQGSTDDEIYVITSVVAADVDGNNIARTERHPVSNTRKWYDDIDTGEVRIGPVAVAWQGNSDPVSVTVFVWEHDQGDPDVYKKQIDDFIKAAIAVASHYYPPALVLELVHEYIADFINWVLDTGDDLIDTQIVVNPRSLLDAYAAQGAVQYYGWKVQWSWGGSGQQPTATWVQVATDLYQNFITTHKGDGATYIVGFDVLRDPPPPPPVIY
jgi:hypothetical protein